MIKLARRALAGAVLLSLTAGASAATVLITLDKEFSADVAGSQDPGGLAPWLKAEFKDVLGGVQLTMTSLLKDSSEFVDQWGFNLDPLLDPLALDIVYQSRTGTFGDNPIVSKGENAFKFDGDGFYDIKFVFDNAPSDDRFGGTDSVTYLLTGISGLDATDFLFIDSGGNKGDFMSAAHVQGILDAQGRPELSGWIGGSGEDVPDTPSGEAPEPGVLFLMGAGLLGLGMARRRKSA